MNDEVDKNMDRLRRQKHRLETALARKRSERWSLTLWGRYIRERDGFCCVVCGSRDRIQAHHIFRKATYRYGKFELGNGITLCHFCHKIPHSEFNGRPDLSLPLGAQGGDDQDHAAYLFSALLNDCNERGLCHDEFYWISDRMLSFFVGIQGYEDLYWAVQERRMTRLEMAYEIWRVMPETWYTGFVAKAIALNM